MECIVHLTQSFACGGLEKVIVNLINKSTERPHKHIVISLTDELSMREMLPEHVEVYSLHKKPGLDLMVHWRLAKLLRKVKATVLHTYNFATLEYHATAKLCGIKRHVHADHGLGGDHPDGKDRIHNAFRKGISYLIDDYVVVSDDLRQWVVDTVGVNPDKVSFVFNGVDVPSKPALLPRKPPKRVHLVIIGRLVEVKNHKRLLDALSIAQKAKPDWDIQLDVVGEGPLMYELVAYAKCSTQEGTVRFHGLRFDIQPYLMQADALALSSDYEAMPMTVLEAMAACRPVICPDVGGVTDFINHEHAMITRGHDTEDLADAILTVAEQEGRELSERIHLAYDKVANEYSLQRMVDHYFSFYVQGEL